jgi:hypothetical protein
VDQGQHGVAGDVGWHGRRQEGGEQPLRALVDALDNIRGRLKDEFKPEIDRALNPRLPNGHIDIKASVDRLVALGARMSSEDKGAMFERWFKDIVVQNADAVVYQQQIDHNNGAGANVYGFSQDRKPDFVYVEGTPQKGSAIHHGYVLEMKSHSGALTKRDIEEIGDYLKLVFHVTPVTMKDGTQVQMQRVIVMMPDLSGASASRDILLAFLKAHPDKFAVLVMGPLGPVFIDNEMDLLKHVPELK